MKVKTGWKQMYYSHLMETGRYGLILRQEDRKIQLFFRVFLTGQGMLTLQSGIFQEQQPIRRPSDGNNQLTRGNESGWILAKQLISLLRGSTEYIVVLHGLPHSELK